MRLRRQNRTKLSENSTYFLKIALWRSSLAFNLTRQPAGWLNKVSLLITDMFFIHYVTFTFRSLNLLYKI